MVRYIQITQVPPERLALWRSWLSPQRRKRAGRMPDDRETVCGEGLARELLAAALHCPPEEVALRYDAQGKPLTDGQHQPQPWAGGLRRGGPPGGVGCGAGSACAPACM